MKAILGGRIVTPSAIVDGMAVLFEDRILDLVPESAVPEQAEKIRANGNYVLPGLVDMHITAISAQTRPTARPRA